MHPVKRFLCMLTYINLILLGGYLWMPAFIQDILRASTLLILIIIISQWFSGNITQIYEEFFNSIIPTNRNVTKQHSIFNMLLTMNPIYKHYFVGIFDILLHVGPVILIGLPRYAISVLIAYICIMTWYYFAKEHITMIYIPSIKADKSLLVMTVFAACLFTVLWLNRIT